MAIIREEIIGDCRKKIRARGHKCALTLYPEIGPCIKCGAVKSERHHIDDNPANNLPDNITPLCRRCRTIEHGKTFAPEHTVMGISAAAKLKREMTHYKRQHALSGENLYLTPDGKRVCKKCRSIVKANYRARGGRG